MATTPYPFVAASVLTASELNSTFNIPVSTKTASYTLVATDAGKRIVMNSASATTITVNTSLFSAGDNLEISNIGAGVCTVTAGTATVSSAGPLAIPQHGGGTLYFTSAGVSTFFGSAGPAASSGLTLINSTTFSGVTSITISNAFSATYRNYKILITNMLATDSTPAIELTFGTTTTNYQFSRATSTSTQFENFADGSSSTTRILFTDISTTIPTQSTIEILAPFLSQKTFVNAFSTGYQNNLFYSTLGCQTDTTSFTSFKLKETNTVNFSGQIETYGYAI